MQKPTDRCARAQCLKLRNNHFSNHAFVEEVDNEGACPRCYQTLRFRDSAVRCLNVLCRDFDRPQF